MGNDMLYRQALKAEAAGRYAEAISLFVDCLADPALDEGDLNFHRGWCLENLGHTEKAIALYGRASDLARHPGCRLNSYFRAGWLVMHEKNFMKAAHLFRCAIDYGDVADAKDDTYAQATYWYAVCLESQGRILDALTWYRYAQDRLALLNPESRYRQIMCLIQVGLYPEALELCHTFDGSAPDLCTRERYETLRAEVQRERVMLEACSSTMTSERKAAPAHAHPHP